MRILLCVICQGNEQALLMVQKLCMWFLACEASVNARQGEANHRRMPDDKHQAAQQQQQQRIALQARWQAIPGQALVSWSVATLTCFPWFVVL
jgi:hypothetical protein